MRRWRTGLAARPGQHGQSLVEFTIVMPVFLLLLTGMLEFGLAFSDRLTLGNATREGARIGGALATGSSTPCSGDPNGVDMSIIASMENILRSGGSDVNLSHITKVTIYKSNSSGKQIGSSNVWHYTPGSGPDADPGPGTEILDFSPSTSGWPACSRSNASSSPDSLAVSIDYDYYLQTPLSAVVSLLNTLYNTGGSQSATIHMVDTTVMALNPTS